MAIGSGNGSGKEARSGAQTLVLLAAPLNLSILQALRNGPKQLTGLRGETGAPAQTTLRSQLGRLFEAGVIAKQRRNRFPGVLEYELTAAGRDLIFVAGVLSGWLARAPDGPLELGGAPAKAAVGALAEGWSTMILRVLAARPLSLTELDGVIIGLSYPSLERRLSALRLSGLVRRHSSGDRGTPYHVTQWLRHGVAPLVAAISWERHHLPRSSPPLSRLDTEAAFLLSAPLLRLPVAVSGSCRVATEASKDTDRRLAGVTLELKRGRPISCVAELRGDPDAWVLGSPGAWLSAVIDLETDRLETGGDRDLARAVIEGLHEALFRPARNLTLDVRVSIGEDRSN